MLSGRTGLSNRSPVLKKDQSKKEVKVQKQPETKLGIDQPSRDLIRLHPNIIAITQFVQKFRKKASQIRGVQITRSRKMCRLQYCKYDVQTQKRVDKPPISQSSFENCPDSIRV